MKQFLLSALFLGLGICLNALNPLPTDPDLKIGKLDNGLTYYIKHNDSPGKQVDFFLAQRVGSVNEEENQRGLAHFLEHMCFNGTEHFPGNTLIEYLESIGVKFGKNLNAYTSTDETVLNICGVPTGRETALDSCVMILADWSGHLTLSESDIEAERGVILGEMRQRSTPGSRILESILPDVYQGGIYGQRMPIGTPDVIENFRIEDIHSYYDKWYNPENQAIIIVGDIDVAKMEEMVIRHCADLNSSDEATAVTGIAVPDNETPIVAIGADVEQASDMVQLYVKEPLLPLSSLGTIEEVRRNYIRALVTEMLVERFDALEGKADCPWSNLGIGIQKFLMSSTRSALVLRATAFDATAVRKTLTTFGTELLRVALHGFTDTELRRAKLSLRARLDSEYANSPTASSTSVARKYVRNFLDGGALPSSEQYYKMMKGVEHTTSVSDVNRYFSEMVIPSGKNFITTVYLTPEDVVFVDTDALKSDFAAIDIDSISPYVDTFVERQFLEHKPQPGKILARADAPFGARLLTLSNGIKVYLRHDSDTPDRVQVRGISPGGISMHYDPDKKGIYKLVDDALAVSGYGGHSSVDLRKILAAHNIKSAVKIGNTTEELSAITTPKDLSVAMQLLYIKATAPTPDDNAFAALMSATRAKLANPNRTATFAMGDSIHSVVYNHHPLGEKLYPADLDKIDYDSIIALHRDRFGDMSDFTYIITGNFDCDSIESLIEQYVASLPGSGRKDKPRDIGYGFYSGRGKYEYTNPMQGTPQSITYTFLNGECPYDLEHILTAQTFGSILKSRLLSEIREKRGLTYGVTSHCSITAGFNGPDTPSRFILPVYIKVAPGHEQEVHGIVEATIGQLITEGPTTDEVQKVKTFLLKEIAEYRSDNAYWETVIKVYDLYDRDMDSGYEELVDRLTPESIRNFGRKYVSGASQLEMTMKPE